MVSFSTFAGFYKLRLPVPDRLQLTGSSELCRIISKKFSKAKLGKEVEFKPKRILQFNLETMVGHLIAFRGTSKLGTPSVFLRLNGFYSDNIKLSFLMFFLHNCYRNGSSTQTIPCLPLLVDYRNVCEIDSQRLLKRWT